ncbi:MAG TPA: ATP-dependent helicase [Mucilaginibacter sp.]|jgi:DNA helicase-2/ATP-dependent DNA helicase PcrA
MVPTTQQQKIIDSPGCLVIIANPGSGKTFVLSEKIKLILPKLYHFQGIIAISYTNKASNELKQRCLKNGLAPQGSFFGTMDKFYLSEIVVPFAKQLFGIPKNEINVVKRQDLAEELRDELNWLDEDFDPEKLQKEHMGFLKKMFLQGQIVLESVALLALYVFDNSRACKNYLKARYAYLFIDEYQDCGKEQHALFLRIKNIGLVAIAVGDANQSIFKFSGKSSEFLIDLGKRKDEFELFPLDYNHRCHPSIINYSLLLLNDKAELLMADSIHVFEKKVTGNEVQIAQWLAVAIPQYKKGYKVNAANKIGILVRNSRTGKLINDNLSLPHKYFETTSLDEDFTIWSGIFRELLTIVFDSKLSKTEFVGKYIDPDTNRGRAISILKAIKQLEDDFGADDKNAVKILDQFEQLAKSLHPTGYNQKSIELLKEIISSSKLLDAYKPALDEEVQIMTLHKSKGLEFDVVFHLDMYEWILPKKEIENRQQFFTDITQDLNLHYVGITRAKKSSVLCYSTQRTNYKNEQKTGNSSEFLDIPVLQNKRLPSPF